MSTTKTIAGVIDAPRVEVAPGFHVRRPFPGPGIKHVDPFLLLDHMGPLEVEEGKEPAVPDHPHRGFEPVTFIFQGGAEHKDSQRNHGIVRSGGVQWMTAGSGIVHSEQMLTDPEQENNTLHGVQLWVNLPRKDKMTSPKYQNIPAADIPVIEVDKVKIRVVAGELLDRKGPAATHTPLLVLHLILAADAVIDIPVPEGFNACYYVLAGEVEPVEGKAAREGQLVALQPGGDQVRIISKTTSDILFLAGAPIEEPVATYGPFVMNSSDELIRAVQDYQEGKMGTIDF